MTPTVERPNRDALQQALDIYRDAMRPFIVRTLRQVQGQQVEDLIANSLHYNQADRFRQNLHEHDGSLEAAIDIGDFPNIIGRNWRDAFSRQFPGDNSVQSTAWLIKGSRDKAAHPAPRDLDTEYARVHLFHIAEVLGLINRPNEKREVERIRDRLLAADAPGEAPREQPAKPTAARDGRRELPATSPPGARSSNPVPMSPRAHSGKPNSRQIFSRFMTDAPAPPNTATPSISSITPTSPPAFAHCWSAPCSGLPAAAAIRSSKPRPDSVAGKRTA